MEARAIREAIRRVVDREDLDEQSAAEAMEEVMQGLATPAQVAGLAIALRMKGETVDEVVGAARVLREHVTRVDAGPGPVVDTAGTGGDASGTFNVSTTAALLAAAAGAKVAKHGNRSVSSRSGSADVLAALGVRIDAPVPVVERCIQEVGIGFLFAPALHPALGHAAAPRRELGVRTLFNLLGPLANPAFADRQVVGVFDKRWVEPIAEVLLKLGTRHAWVVHGSDGLDELTLTGVTHVSEVRDRTVHSFRITPDQVGLNPCQLADLEGGDPETNAAITRRILEGERGPKADMACLNAAAALLVSGKAEDLQDGVEQVREAIRSGRALETLNALVRVSQSDR
ncbi:MAG: anthranilate phosphoribosyltransferase [Deltaproteobacteria bacterium]|nr:MAG: anthranilate phosphoribosyltransferase [Deltaproteobacteria bacterium]